MNRLYAFLLLLFTLLGCGTSFQLVLNEDPDAIEIEILYSDDCQSKDLYFDTLSSIQFYTITTAFNFSRPAPYTFLTPDEDGRYSFEFTEDYYYYEVISTEGEKLFSGLFTFPDDLSNGKLRLARGRKKGMVKEKVDEGYFAVSIPNAEVIHTNEITGEEFIHYSDEDGNICIELDAGRYTVEVNHPDYFSYIPQGGFNVFPNYSSGVNNFFLEKK